MQDHPFVRVRALEAHDDGPDALEMAVHAAEEPQNHFMVQDFDGRVTYDSRWPKGVRFGKHGRMSDRL